MKRKKLTCREKSILRSQGKLTTKEAHDLNKIEIDGWTEPDSGLPEIPDNQEEISHEMHRL